MTGHAGKQLAEPQDPDHNPFYGAYVRDWIALCDDLRDADVRGYLILRSLVFERKGVTNRVRLLTLAELCQLIPGPNGKPSSLSRIRELLRCLSAVGLITTPEGGPVTTSSGGKAQGRPVRIKIHDQPANTFTPRWPNTKEKLASIRPKAEQTARAAVERDASRAAAKAAGQDSDQRPRGRNPDRPGRISDHGGWKSDQDSGDALEERAPHWFSCTCSSSTAAQPDGSAGGQSAGGFACAGSPDGAAPGSPTAVGGVTADSSKPAATGQGEDASAAKPKRRAVKSPLQISELRPVAGEDEVYAMLDALGVLSSPATRISTLRRAVREFLGHYADARSGPFAMYPRRPEHAALRMSLGWHKAGGPLRSSAGYRGGDRIARPVGYLAELLTKHECDHPNCEVGRFLDTGEECNTCQYRAAERICQAKGARLLAEQQIRSSAVADLRVRKLPDERERAHGDVLEKNPRRDAVSVDAETARLCEQLAADQPELADAAIRTAEIPSPRAASGASKRRLAIEQENARVALLREGLRGTALDDAIRSHVAAWKAKRREEAQAADLAAGTLPVGSWPTGHQQASPPPF
ncbi:hypothetical protein ACFWB2_20725 [Streptomyces virginiae]|uniref:hypothetical protein n=1 Tax=Streptomyces virginiae TaxID=1961 RepID=UPI0036913082